MTIFSNQDKEDIITALDDQPHPEIIQISDNQFPNGYRKEIQFSNHTTILNSYQSLVLLGFCILLILFIDFSTGDILNIIYFMYMLFILPGIAGLLEFSRDYFPTKLVIISLPLPVITNVLIFEIDNEFHLLLYVIITTVAIFYFLGIVRPFEKSNIWKYTPNLLLTTAVVPFNSINLTDLIEFISNSHHYEINDDHNIQSLIPKVNRANLSFLSILYGQFETMLPKYDEIKDRNISPFSWKHIFSLSSLPIYFKVECGLRLEDINSITKSDVEFIHEESISKDSSYFFDVVIRGSMMSFDQYHEFMNGFVGLLRRISNLESHD